MKEYKLAKGWSILIYVLAPLLTALFVWLPIMMLTDEKNHDLKSFWIMLPICIGMIVIAAVSFLDAIKGVFVIDSDKLFNKSTLSYRCLMFDEIKGFRITDKYIFIEPIDPSKKKIKITTYIEKKDEIIDWLSSHYSDLDVVSVTQEYEKILADEKFGWTEEEREKKLNQARKAAKIVNWTGGIIAAWTLLIADPYELAILSSIAIPIICLIVLKYFNGLIRIDQRKDSAYPSIFIGIFASAMALLMRALKDYIIFNHANVWLPTMSIVLVYTSLLVITSKEFNLRKVKSYVTILAILIPTFCYSYGTVIVLNCMYDKSNPELFNAEVLDKRINSGKSTTYYIKLSAWGRQQEIDEVSVSKKLYNEVEIKDSVNIFFMKGRFEIPWIEITK
jgi:hypothetical protein